MSYCCVLVQFMVISRMYGDCVVARTEYVELVVLLVVVAYSLPVDRRELGYSL